MKLNIKIIGLLIFGFLAISASLTLSSISLLRKNQSDNIMLFKQEFLELSTDSFTDNSNLFFYALDNKIQTSTSSAGLLSSLENIDQPDTVIYSVSEKKFLIKSQDSLIAYLLDPTTLNKDIQENILNQKSMFDIDNFQDFLLDNSGKVYPVKIQLRFYNQLGLIIGYTKAFTTTKIRLEFIQRKNAQLFQSYIYSALTMVAIILLISTSIMIYLMQTVVINPLKKISFGLEQVKTGILNAKINIKNKDEIGQIAEVFNKMTDDLEISKNKLSEYSTSLEQKVEERTVALNSKLSELEKINNLMIDRELKMIELKKQIEDLENKLKQKTN